MSSVIYFVPRLNDVSKQCCTEQARLPQPVLLWLGCAACVHAHRALAARLAEWVSLLCFKHRLSAFLSDDVSAV
jgi:hypothetical protein